jgi:hypothetical protein
VKRVLLTILLLTFAAPVFAHFPRFAAAPRGCTVFNQGDSYYNTTDDIAYVCVNTTWTSVLFQNPLLISSQPFWEFTSQRWTIGQSVTTVAVHVTPLTSVVTGVSASGTDVVGGALEIQAGAGTGTARGGNLNFQVSMPGLASGSTLNSYNSVFTANTTNGAVSLGSLQLGSGTAAGTSIWAGPSRADGVTDQAGGPVVIRGGQGTGTGFGGGTSIQVAMPAAATATTQNGYSTAFNVSGTNGSINIGGLNYVGNPTTSNYNGTNRAAGITDGSAGGMTIAVGRGTGTGVGGTMSIQVAPKSGASGTTQNALQNGILINGTNGAVQVGGVTNSHTDALTGSLFTGASRAAGVTDGAGGDLTLRPGQGTGTGSGGNLVFQISPAAASTATTVNAFQNAAQFTQASVAVGGWNFSGTPGASSFAAPNRLAGVTDGTGGNLTISAGRSTGTGTGGALTLQVSPPAAGTGSAQNGLQTVFTASGGTGAVTVGGVQLSAAGATGTSTFAGNDSAAGTTDKAGGVVHIEGGQSTGTGAEGNVVIRLSPPAASTGTGQNTLVDVERWDTGSVADPQTRTVTLSANNGSTWIRGSNSELLTLSTAGATTNTSANLLPANSIIEAVVIRVTTAISGGGVTAFSVGDSTTAARFSASAGGLTLGSTRVGLQHQQGSVTTDAAGPVQVTATTVRITCDATPTAGVIRIIVYYKQFVAPTS